MQMFRDDQSEHRIAQKLEPFHMNRRGRTMGQRPFQQREIVEPVTQPPLQGCSLLRHPRQGVSA